MSGELHTMAELQPVLDALGAWALAKREELRTHLAHEDAVGLPKLHALISLTQSRIRLSEATRALLAAYEGMAQ